MEKNKTGRYFKYAIGEIVLVVIGILIALSINNWNEERKLDKTTKVLLRQIQLDILSNMDINKRAYNVYNRRDSIFWTMRQKKLTPSDFAGEKGRRYRVVISTAFGFKMINKGFEQLKVHPGIKPGEYTALINELEGLESDLLYFNENIQRSGDEQGAHFNFRRANYDWFSSELWTGERANAELEFYANDPILKNYITFIIRNMGQALIAAESYTYYGLKTYRTIAKILGQEEDELPDEIRNYYADIPTDSLTAFTGSYVLHYAPPLNSTDRFSHLDSIVISIERENKLKLKKYTEGDLYEKDLSIRSINKLEEIDWERRVYYSINEDGYLQIKDYIGLPYLFKKIKD